MKHMVIVDAVPADQRRRGSVRADLLFGFALAFILSACWAVRDWAQLSRLILPDADDMMRLAQVRDWLAGQGVNDWTQYRMAPPLGAPMHWSRVNDVGPAGIILVLRSVLGRWGAELAAVLAYPALLFGLHLFLSARNARRLWGTRARAPAIVLGALAYPGTTVFVPGRIDHHALQVVLTELAVLVLIRPARFGAGAIAGTAMALSLVIGLEAAPQIAGLLAVAFALWVRRGEEERDRMVGLAAGLGATTATFVAFFRPTLWSPALCDAFTPASSQATLAGAATLALLGLVGGRLPNRRSRLAVSAILGGGALAAVLYAHPACLEGPYGRVDPFLQREFISHIDEANSILRQTSLVRGVQLGGLMLVGCLGALWTAWCRPRCWPIWGFIAGPVLVSGLLTFAQLRGTYIGTPMAAPILAGVILTARAASRRGAVLVAWLACAGLTWLQLPQIVREVVVRVAHPDLHSFETGMTFQMMCNSGDTWAEVDRYPPGVVMAPTNMASYMIGATRMATVGAGYHRNNRGNIDMYRYFLSSPERGAPIARAWRVAYVAFCPGDFSEMDVVKRFPHSLATMLTLGSAPANFQRLPLRGSRLRFYRLIG